MLTSLYGRYIGVFAAICVLALFFFPLVHGPFQATHGPTTALRAKRAFLILLLTIALVALRLVASRFPILLDAVHRFIRGNHCVEDRRLAVCDRILRC